MTTKPSSIAYAFLCTLFIAIAQLFYKLGSKTLMIDLMTMIKNYYLIIGLTLYFIAAIIFIIALKSGELSTLFPIISMSYVWVSLLSIKFLGERMSILKWIGVLAVVIGVSFIGIGSRRPYLKS